MIIHNIQEKYLYVPIGKNAILDPNLKCKDKMYLAVLELYKTNPKYQYDAPFLVYRSTKLGLIY